MVIWYVSVSSAVVSELWHGGSLRPPLGAMMTVWMHAMT
jgi:hypothetical protein